jgi:hypothetical protein
METRRKNTRNGGSGLTKKEQEIWIQKQYSTEDFSASNYVETYSSFNRILISMAGNWKKIHRPNLLC